MTKSVDLPGYLTKEQQEAILHDGGPLLIIAGPGSGKTEVLTWRVAYLIESGRTAPGNCLVSTFTRKAALELKDRIQQKLPEVDVEKMAIGTIHSLCADILREHQTRSPVPRGFRILDEDGQLLLIYRNRADLGLDAVMKGRPQDFFSGVLRMFNLATEELVKPEKLLDWCRLTRQAAEEYAVEAGKGRSKLKAQKAADAVELWKEEAIVTEAYQAYCDLLHSRNLVDFAFLQRHCLDLLESHPNVAAALRERFRMILVDEYQDTNAAQEMVLHHLAGEGQRLTVVGDDDQSIYRFRGATVGNLLGFEKRYPGARKIYLQQNFRSPDPIVRSSQAVIANNQARFPKDLFTARGEGSDIVLLYEHSVAEEAASVARFLAGLKAMGKVQRWGDVALLLRSVRSYCEDYVQALTAERIPVNVIGDAGFFGREDIAQLCNLFHFLGATKPWGDVHIRCPLMGLGDNTVEALKAYKGNLMEAESDEALLSIGIKNTTDRKKILSLLTLKRRTQGKKQESILSVFYELLAITGYVRDCQGSGNVTALMNLGVMSGMISLFDELGGTRNLYPFQEYFQLLIAGGAEPSKPSIADAVQLMTIHQAKGLEFPVVVLGSVMDGRLPSMRRRDRYEVPYELRASGQPEVEDPHLTDERKLFYVGATRAKELLILGTADIVNKRGGGPSPFLKEMFGEDLHAIANAGRARIKEVESARDKRAGPRERISFSQLAYFLQCPVRYELAVMYGLEPLHPDPVDFGANVHRALLSIHERALVGANLTDSDIAEIVEDSWLSPVSVAEGSAPAQERDARKAAVKQLRRYVREHTSDLGRVEKAELSFSFRLEESVLLGRIDLIRKEEGGIEVVDFKTSESSKERVEQEQVETQLDIYALGAEIVCGRPVTKRTAHFLGSGEVDSRPWSPDKAAHTRERLSGILGLVAARSFQPRTEFCTRCTEFRSICMCTGR
ncbi:MAG: ATP-dependent DNA helicase [Spirochaetes bacterium]|nr:ATP-dependent DNA helicase [Spirochaetota bacterium]